MAGLNLPKGLVVQGYTNLKDFVEVDKLALADYLLSIKNINTGAGGKVNLQNLIKSINSTSDKNLIVQGDDGKLLVSTELFKTINDVSILGSGDVFTPSQKEAINSGVSTNTVSQVETNRANISELDGRMTTAENDIDSLETRMTTAEGNIDKKQDTLISGTNIKTINGNSIIGSGDVEISSTGQGQGMPIGTVYPCLCTADYVPEGALPCNGAEYTKEQFTDLWNNYLSTSLLNTCTYTEYASDISTYGQCAKFGIITGEGLNPNYTYIGNLSVDSSGIASNFSSSNYATVPVSFTLTPESNFYYKTRVKLYADVSGGFKRCITAFYYGDTFNNNELQLSYLGDNGHIDFYFNLKHADGQGTIALLSVNEYFNEGDWVTVEYIKNGTTFTVKVTNDLGETHEATTENISIKTNTYTLARIGKGDDGASDYYESDIDLSSVLIKVDNIEIFNGTKSNTFKVPTIKDGAVIQQALTNSKLGKSYNAGLPNITGKVVSDYSSNWEGVFYDGGTIKGGGGSGNDSIAIFDASRSSSIYGNSDTVQPNAVALRYFVVVANGQINQSMMDWSAWASSLQGKANTDLSNLSNSGKKVIDGQWVGKTATLSTATAVGTYTIDLSSYLPNDNYNYEVLIHLDSNRAGTGNASIGIYTNHLLASDTPCLMCGNGYGDAINIILPLFDRTIYIQVGERPVSHSSIIAYAYRRIGTNP